MKICLGIAGSIAAYRSADVLKKLVAAGHEVQCVLTASGREFVTPKVLETFSSLPVLSHDSFDSSHMANDHIATARWADLFLIYGATADFLAKIAMGLADDFLSLQLLAFDGPVLLAPAMNPAMWSNAATRANVATLRARGYHFSGPIFGKVSCGEDGIGHVASDDDILLTVQKLNREGTQSLPGLAGKKVLISSGPMRTALDPMRFIQNRSSGKMGLSLARACKKLGASQISILLGPVAEDIRRQYEEFSVKTYESPKDYEDSLDSLFPLSDIFFSAAAVLDFQSIPRAKKIERVVLSQSNSLEMEIRSVPDIVAKFGARKKSGQKVIAFAAESGTEAEIIERAHAKMLKKSADAMIANPLWPGLGPESDQNQIWLLRPNRSPLKFGPAPKDQLSDPILQALFGES